MSTTCPDCLTFFVPDPNEGMSDVRCDACEGARIMAEADHFRQPAPPPIPVRKCFYITECEHCAWVGSSEQCGGEDDEIVCPVCCSSICGDEPSEADIAKHGEAVMQRILDVEAKATAAEQEAARWGSEYADAMDARMADAITMETLQVAVLVLAECKIGSGLSAVRKWFADGATGPIAWPDGTMFAAWAAGHDIFDCNGAMGFRRRDSGRTA